MYNFDIQGLQKHGLAKLDVYVNAMHVALLAKEGRRYVLTYLPGVPRDHFVSLSMPVRSESWVSEGRLHPFFEINLPEGVRRDAIAAVTEDMSLLALTGNDTIGRVSVVPSGYPLDWKPRCLIDVDAALKSDTDVFFERALSEYATQGISGVQPKILKSTDRTTLKSDQWILKHDSPKYEFISVNEYLSMKAADASGMRVPDCLLSEDRHSIFVKRFDTDGFEDMCALMGLSPSEKYAKSTERMIKVASEFVNDRHGMRLSVLRSVVFNTCIGNSDAHLKNFGLVYSDKEIALSPFYDLVSVRAFPEFRRDIPALTIGGKQEWVIGKAFHTLAMNIGVTKHETKQIIQEVTDGVTASMPSIARMADDYPPFRDHAKNMVMLWDAGLKRIHGDKFAIDQADSLVNQGMSAGQEAKIGSSDNPYRDTTSMGEWMPKF